MPMFRRMPARRARWLVLLAGLFAALPLFSLQDPSLLGNPDPPRHCRDLAPPWAGLQPPPAPAAEAPELRVVTYNLHSGLGPTHARNRPRAEVEATLRAIAGSIVGAAGAPDVLGLNEVDFHAARSGRVDQAAFLAAELERLTGYTYTVIAGPTWSRDVPGEDVQFGNALLARHPVEQGSSCLFGSAECGGETAALQAGGSWVGRIFAEPRGVVRATLQVGGRTVDVLLTHLEAFAAARREAQAAALLQGLVRPGRDTVLLGDINAVPSEMTGRRWFLAADRTHDVLSSGALADARMIAAAARGSPDLSPWATYPASAPAWPLDAVFASTTLWPDAVSTVGQADSDHLGLYVRYRWAGPGTPLAQLHARMKARQLARVEACDLVGPAEVRLPRLQWMLEATSFWKRPVEDLASAD